MDRLEYEKIIADAIQGEIESQQFYRDAAGRMQDAFLQEMFTEFAAEEKNHEKILSGFLSTVSDTLPFEETRDYHVAETVARPEVSADMSPADAFALAMKKEAEAMDRYTRLADGCTDPEQKRIFLDLAAMERRHKLKMENAFVDIGYPEAW